MLKDRISCARHSLSHKREVDAQLWPAFTLHALMPRTKMNDVSLIRTIKYVRWFGATVISQGEAMRHLSTCSSLLDSSHVFHRDRHLDDSVNPLGICFRFRDCIRQQLQATAEWLSIQLEQILGRVRKQVFPSQWLGKAEFWATWSQERVKQQGFMVLLSVSKIPLRRQMRTNKQNVAMKRLEKKKKIPPTSRNNVRMIKTSFYFQPSLLSYVIFILMNEFPYPVN